ncbi:MAG TPA: hypothetical protein DCY94_02685 [Firmicutes bacterium]|nr:hypothetical protein [Bacillota bacterium]
MYNFAELFDKKTRVLYDFIRNRVVSLKRYYKVQVAIDVSIVILGLFLAFFPSIVNYNANIALYTLMGVYAGLELLEYLLSRCSFESLYLCISAGVCAFSGFFLKNYSPPGVISASILVWILLTAIIKIMNLQNIYIKKTRLFIIKLGLLSAYTTIGVLVSINIYFKISQINYMLSLLFLSYGFLELVSDLLEYLSDDVKFLKE